MDINKIKCIITEIKKMNTTMANTIMALEDFYKITESVDFEDEEQQKDLYKYLEEYYIENDFEDVYLFDSYFQNFESFMCKLKKTIENEKLAR